MSESEQIRENILRGIHKLHHKFAGAIPHPPDERVLKDIDVLSMLKDIGEDYQGWRKSYYDLFWRPSGRMEPQIPFYWTIALKELSELNKILKSGGYWGRRYHFQAQPESPMKVLLELPTATNRPRHVAGAVLQILKDATELFPFVSSDSLETEIRIAPGGAEGSDVPSSNPYDTSFEKFVDEKFDEAIKVLNAPGSGLPAYTSLEYPGKHVYYPWFKREDPVLGPGGDFGGGRTIRKKRGRRTRNSRKSSRRVRGRAGRKKKRNRTKKRKARSKTYKRTKRRRTLRN